MSSLNAILSTSKQVDDAAHAAVEQGGRRPSGLWVGVRATDANPFMRFFSRFVAASLNDSAEPLRHAGRPLRGHSVESELGERKEWYSERIADALDITSLRDTLAMRPFRRTIVIPFVAHEAIDAFAMRRQWRLAAPAPSYRRHLENKQTVAAVVDELGLPKRPTVTATVGTITFASARKRLGSPKAIVVQIPTSISGSGTFLVRNSDEWRHNISTLPPETCLSICPVIDGPTVSVSCVVLNHDVVIGPLTQQVVHIPELANPWAVYCGNVFHSSDWTGKRHHIRTMVRKIGLHIQRGGFRGILNLNLLAAGPFLTDINPRLMGHFRLLADLQRMTAGVDFGTVHLTALLGSTGSLSVQLHDSLADSDRTVSLLVAHNLATEPSRIRGRVLAGFYALDTARPIFLRSQDASGCVPNDGEFFVADPIPMAGAVVHPGAELFRLHVSGNCVDEAGRLTPNASAIVAGIRHILDGDDSG